MAAFDNTQTIRQAVVDGLGIALLPEPIVRREVEAGVLAARPLKDGPFVRRLGIIRGKRHKLGPAAQRFLDFLRENGNAPPHRPERGATAMSAPPAATATPPERRDDHGRDDSPNPFRKPLAPVLGGEGLG